MTPVDWDQESYCIEDDCIQPATHERLLSMVDDGTPVVELVCCHHATGVR